MVARRFHRPKIELGTEEEDAFAATIGALTAPVVVVLAPLVSPSNYCEQMRDRPLAQVCRRFDIASGRDENLCSTLFVANNREIDRRKTTCENIVPP